MAIKQTLGTKTTLTVTGLSTLASGADAASDEMDLLNALVNGVGLSVDISLGIAVAESNSVNVYLIGSNTSASYGSLDDYSNLKLLDGVSMSESTAKKTIQIPADLLSPYFKLVFVNDCSAALTSASVDYVSRSVVNA